MGRILVQDRRTKLLLRDFDEWTADISAARDFKTSLNALAFCLQHDLVTAQILVRFEDADHNDIVVPLTPEEPALRPAE